VGAQELMVMPMAAKSAAAKRRLLIFFMVS
jgi:hypothetical protein